MLHDIVALGTNFCGKFQKKEETGNYLITHSDIFAEKMTINYKSY